MLVGQIQLEQLVVILPKIKFSGFFSGRIRNSLLFDNYKKLFSLRHFEFFRQVRGCFLRGELG